MLHQETVEGLGRIAEAVAEIRRLDTEDQRSLRIACSVGFATYWLMPRLATFYERPPEVAVHVMTAPKGAPELGPGGAPAPPHRHCGLHACTHPPRFGTRAHPGLRPP